MAFVPLRILSAYTMLEGAIDPKDIAKTAARHGFPAAALTDRNGLYAAMPFADACRAAGVQPIIGTMLGVARPGEVQGPPPSSIGLRSTPRTRPATPTSARWCPRRISAGR
jgi:DNA polymerase-3 subunit alpha